MKTVYAATNVGLGYNMAREGSELFQSRPTSKPEIAFPHEPHILFFVLGQHF